MKNNRGLPEQNCSKLSCLPSADFTIRNLNRIDDSKASSVRGKAAQSHVTRSVQKCTMWVISELSFGALCRATATERGLIFVGDSVTQRGGERQGLGQVSWGWRDGPAGRSLVRSVNVVIAQASHCGVDSSEHKRDAE